jgi:hypothetical protein
MTRHVSRRRFVQSTLAAGALSAAAAPRAHVKVGLYGITYGGVWCRGDALTVEQVISRALEAPADQSDPNWKGCGWIKHRARR